MKILIAEDDNFLASAYRVKLKKGGHEVKLAYDGNELFAHLKNCPVEGVMALSTGFFTT